jgi:predicted CxxxxCH...CXXCH cytochrome family protein
MNDTLAPLVTGDGTLRPSPAWNGTTCSNTYCHGNWKLRKATSAYQFVYNATDSVMVGAAYAPAWTGGSAQAACGTCHGLPPQGHTAAFGACVNCHSDVVGASMQIINPAKHMNGKINALTVELPMR